MHHIHPIFLSSYILHIKSILHSYYNTKKFIYIQYISFNLVYNNKKKNIYILYKKYILYTIQKIYLTHITIYFFFIYIQYISFNLTYYIKNIFHTYYNIFLLILHILYKKYIYILYTIQKYFCAFLFLLQSFPCNTKYLRIFIEICLPLEYLSILRRILGKHEEKICLSLSDIGIYFFLLFNSFSVSHFFPLF